MSILRSLGLGGGAPLEQPPEQGRAPLLRQLNPSDLRTLEQYLGSRPVGLVFFSLRPFFLDGVTTSPEQGLAMLKKLEEKARMVVQACVQHSEILFSGQWGLFSVGVFAKLLSGKEVLLAEEAQPMATLLLSRMREAFPKDMAGLREISVGTGMVRPAPRNDTQLALYQALWRAEASARQLSDRVTSSVHEEFMETLRGGGLQTQFQSIVDFVTGEVVGWEALTSGEIAGQRQSFLDLGRLARDTGVLGDLDHFCTAQALRSLGGIRDHQALFLNVLPQTILQPGSHTRMAEQVHQYGFRPANIVIELSDRLTKGDLNVLLDRLEAWRMEGFRLAIDEVWADRSSLRFLAELRPRFVKVDISLIGSVDTNPANRLMVETLVTMANKMNSKVMAVGVETPTELTFLMSQGVAAGQGNYLSKPSRLKQEACFSLPARGGGEQGVQMARSGLPTNTMIGSLVRAAIELTPNTTVEETISIMRDTPPITSCVVVNERKALGIIMRYTLDRQLSSQFGHALYTNRPVLRIMDTDFLTVDAATPIEDAARMAMKRKEEKVYDDILVTRDDFFAGAVSVQHMLDSLAQVKVELAKGANPLTGLPGNLFIEQEIERRASGMLPTCLMYVDLDNFKVYNDVYGFDQGDQMILLVADVLRTAVQDHGGCGDLLGHIGGDDFMCITTPDHVEAISSQCLRDFSQGVTRLYSAQDNERGYIEGVGRDGAPGRYGLASLSVGALTCEFDGRLNMHDLSLAVARVKKAAKAISGNSLAKANFPEYRRGT